MANELVLIVDDEPSITQLVRMYLERESFRVETVGDGNQALQTAKEKQPALMVLDIMLPGLDGLEVCRKIRASGNPVPIIMLTARDEDIDKILGLELGADDYLTKPFNPRELVARIKAILRRMERPPAAAIQSIQLADLSIDPAAHEAYLGDRLLNLRTQEFDLLLTLAQNHGRVLSREKLLQLAWGFDFYGQTRTVDVHIALLRKKLEGGHIQIETVTGVGYKLVA